VTGARSTAALVAASIALVAIASGSSAAAAPRPAADRYTPVVQSVMSTPRWFRGADGRFHLAYELRLTNAFPIPVRVHSVVVRGAGGAKIARLRGGRLKGSTSLLASPTEPTTTLPPSSVGVVWFDLAFRRRAAIPTAVSHRLTVHLPPGLPVPTTISSTGGHAAVDRRPPVVLGPPLRGRGWLAVGSCCDGPHRRALQPVNGHLRLGQRFAIDWNGIDRQRRLEVGDPDRNRSWVFYGKPVIAVADARVAAAVDRFPNQVPNHPKPVTLT
jgi:hypothetical protein